jgi:hypothetical protein
MSSIVGMVEMQSLNAIVAGFSFASAIAWMDVVRWIIANVIKVNKSSGVYVVLAALLTTLLAILVYIVLSKLSPKVEVPSKPIYAVVA